MKYANGASSLINVLIVFLCKYIAMILFYCLTFVDGLKQETLSQLSVQKKKKTKGKLKIIITYISLSTLVLNSRD